MGGKLTATLVLYHLGPLFLGDIELGHLGLVVGLWAGRAATGYPRAGWQRCICRREDTARERSRISPYQ